MSDTFRQRRRLRTKAHDRHTYLRKYRWHPRPAGVAIDVASGHDRSPRGLTRPAHCLEVVQADKVPNGRLKRWQGSWT